MLARTGGCVLILVVPVVGAAWLLIDARSSRRPMVWSHIAGEAVHHRIRAYEDLARKEAVALRNWEATSFPPLVRLLDERGWLKVLTWESCIDAIPASAPRPSRGFGPPPFRRHLIRLFRIFRL